MTLASVLLPPSLDPKQALRLRRFGLSCLTYALSGILVAVAWAFGMMPGHAALQIGAMFLMLNLGLYAAIRWGFNLRFADPSLTRFQLLAAIAVLMYITYQMEENRSIVLFGCFVIFQFGIFRLSARQFTLVTLFTLASYALVINLLMHLRPQAIQSVPAEWMSWLLLAGFMPVYAIIGGQVNALRRRLSHGEARFRSLTEMTSEFYWETDAGHRIVVRSSADSKIGALSLFRRGAQAGERRWEVPYLSPDEAGWSAHRADLDARRPFRHFEFSRLALDGEARHMEVSGDPVFDARSAFTGYRGVGNDITARKRAEQGLQDAVQRLRLVADNIPVMAAYWDEGYRCRFASKAFAGAFGLTVEQAVGRHAREIIGEELLLDNETESAALILEGKAVTFHRSRTFQDGVLRHLEVRLTPDIGAQGKVVGCFTVTIDITAHRQAQERLTQAAHHDPLTGLPNRALFDDRLGQAITLARRDSRSFALLYLDLDRFKPVNDSLGHAAGDELLKAVGQRIARQVRESDTVARVGGDEFVVILTDVGRREDAASVIRKITRSIAEPYLLGSRQQSVRIGASIGMAMFPADGGDSETLVSAADAAMFAAKQGAKGEADREMVTDLQ